MGPNQPANTACLKLSMAGIYLYKAMMMGKRRSRMTAIARHKRLKIPNSINAAHG
jgi:hypothetical protein